MPVKKASCCIDLPLFPPLHYETPPTSCIQGSPGSPVPPVCVLCRDQCGRVDEWSITEDIACPNLEKRSMTQGGKGALSKAFLLDITQSDA